MEQAYREKAANARIGDPSFPVQRDPVPDDQELRSLINRLGPDRARAQELEELAQDTELRIVSRLVKAFESVAPRDLERLREPVMDYLSLRKHDLASSLNDLSSKRNEYAGKPAAGLRGEPPARRTNREAFLASREWLLGNCMGMAVAFANGQLIATDASFERLMDDLPGLGATAEVYVDWVSEESFGEPEIAELPGLGEVEELLGENG